MESAPADITAAGARATVFVTHAAPKDNEIALWISSKLATAGYRVWIDQRRLRGGDDFWDEIDRVLRNHAIKQVVVFTRHVTKPGVKKEFDSFGNPKRSLQEPARIAWNFATTLYFKARGQPWQLADVRPGVCYVGIVFKRDSSPAAHGEACCAAQMFLNSGNGVVFRGALGPWYSEQTGEFHLNKEAAADLIAGVVAEYKKGHGGQPPKELFIHGRQRFSTAEWSGFQSAVPPETSLVGVRIRPTQDLRLFRPREDVPVLRGCAVIVPDREGYLWTTGYVPRLRTYPGFETPKPLRIDITHGQAEMMTVMHDILGLTKVNYNACDYASGLPVTLKFANLVGDILTASPKGQQAPPLPFRFYI